MEFKLSKPNKKQAIIISVVVLLLAGGGITAGVLKHNSDAKAQAVQTAKDEAEQAKKDKAAKAYKKQLNEATSAVVKAEKSKTQEDVDTAIKLLPTLKSVNKEALQKRLNTVNKTIAEAKAKAAQEAADKAKAEQEAAAKAKSEQEAASAQANQQAAAAVPNQAGQSAQNSYASGGQASQDNGYVAPQAPQAPSQDYSSTAGQGKSGWTSDELNQAERDASNAPAFDWNQK